MSDKNKFRLLFVWCLMLTFGGFYYSYQLKLHEDWSVRISMKILDEQTKLEKLLTEIKAIIEEKDE